MRNTDTPILPRMRIDDVPDIPNKPTDSTGRVSAAIPKDIERKLDDLRARGKNVSALVRMLLEDFFKYNEEAS